ncbi:MAG: SAM-dependent methyltransferase [Candidatus Sumerlaeia bacterium]|nr:SAM-dependent methyltransferase [Candidatus Sumerlaeia bacterium]
MTGTPSPESRGLALSGVVPWGRGLSEYVRMFGLGGVDREVAILDVASGPSSFNAEVTAAGGSVLSLDPIYQFSRDEIASRISETRDMLIDKVREKADFYNWVEFPDMEALATARMEAMGRFLDDYTKGRDDGRYRVGNLPRLDLPADSFDLALSSHFLYSYSDQFDAGFHVASVVELLRVAREVRIFPILSIDGTVSPWLEEVRREVTARGWRDELVPANYGIQKGPDFFHRIRRE